MRHVRLAVAIAALFSTTSLAVSCASPPPPEPPTEVSTGEDWPGFRGANRQGRSGETGLLRSWPDDGPERLWAVTGVGEGHSSPTVAGGRVFVTGMRDATAHLDAFDTDGRPLWSAPLGPEDPKRQFAGPRASVTAVGERVYVATSAGRLVCARASSGETVWAVDLPERFGVGAPELGFCESVLVDGAHVIVTPGGASPIAALDAETGATAWTTKGAELKASCCSPVLMERAGRTLIVAVLTGAIIGVDRADGELLWRHPFAEKRPGGACVSPVVTGDLLFTASEKRGAIVLEVAADGASVEEKWSLNNQFDVRYGGAVEVDGYLYGTGREKRVRLMCVALATGQIMWSESDLEKGSVIAADGLVFYYSPREGELALLRADPKGAVIAGRFEAHEGTNEFWGHPALSDGRLYVRHGDEMMCFEVRAGPAAAESSPTPGG